MSDRSRRALHAFLGMSMTIGFLWLVLRRIDPSKVLAAVTQVRWYILPLTLIFLAAGYTTRIIRWWLMLRACDAHIKLGSCVWPLLVSTATNNVAPFRVGDALRVVGFRRQLGAPAVRVAGTLLVERILDTTVLLGFFIVGIAGLKGTGVSIGYARAALAVGGAVLLAWTVVLLCSRRAEVLLRRACHHRLIASRGWSETAELHVHQLFDALEIIRTPAQSLGFLLISIVVWTFEGLVFQTLAAGLSYHGDWRGPWFSFAAGTFSTLIPSSPGYVGTFDFFALSGLMAYGESRDVAAAFAFFVHAALWLPVTAAGFVFILLPMSMTGRERMPPVLSSGQDAS